MTDDSVCKIKIIGFLLLVLVLANLIFITYSGGQKKWRGQLLRY